MMQNSSHIKQKVNDQAKLIHYIEELSQRIDTHTYRKEKDIFEKILDYLIELQIIKSKELA